MRSGLLLVALLAACTAPVAPGATPTASGTANARRTNTATPTSRATRSPAPVPPGRDADVLLRLERFSDIPGASVSLVVMADGRFVDRTKGGAVIERRLTASGVQHVRDEVFGIGLFARDQSYVLEPAPGQTIQPHGYTGIAFVVWNGTRTVRVSTFVVPSGDESLYQPSAARDALLRLAQRMEQLETWLPASAWAEPVAHPFAPAAFRVVTTLKERGPIDVGLPEVDAIDWPFSTSLLEFGSPLTTPGEPNARCEMLGRDDEGRVRDALTRGGAALVTDWNGAWYATLDAGSLGVLGVFGFPLWPDETSCAGANLR